MEYTQEVVKEDSQFGAALEAHLAQRLGPSRYELWFGEQAKFLIGEERLLVLTPTTFMGDLLRRNFSQEIRDSCLAVTGRDLRVEFQVAAEAGPVLVDGVAAPESASMPTNGAVAPHASAKKRKPTKNGRAAGQAELPFDAAKNGAAAEKRVAEPMLTRYIVGKENEYAFTAAEMTARGRQQASPLTLHGTTGVGKTFLLRAIRDEYRRLHPRARVVYLTAEQFTTNYVDAVRGSGMPSFRQKCRGADLFLLDDIQFFAGKRGSLEELLHTVDAALAEGRQMVFAGDRSLAELRPLGQELVSRLAGGLTCEIRAPEFETRVAIVRMLRDEIGVDFGDDVASVIAAQITASARELRGAIYRLQAESEAQGEPISRELATKTLGELAQQSVRAVRLADVEQAVCDVFGVEPAQLRSDRKSRAVHEPRMLAMWLARKYTRAPWSEIGQHFGRRSHSSVIAANKKVEQLIRERAEVGLSDRSCSVEEAIRRVEAVLRTA